MACAASVHLKAAFAASHKAYGSRSLRTAMADRGLSMGRHRMRTLMRLNRLRGWGSAIQPDSLALIAFGRGLRKPKHTVKYPCEANGVEEEECQETKICEKRFKWSYL